MVAEGLVPDSRQASALLMAGKVFCGTRRLKAGDKVAPGDAVTVTGLHDKYLSKGGWKLEKALEAFRLPCENRVCLDAGASTGGFTDCLLKHGARTVYAVDVGFGQLHANLRQDERVVNLEKTNLGDEKLLSLSPAPTLATCDLSYLSLRTAVPLYRAILKGQGDLVCLVKPLFEVEDAKARRTGALPDGCFAPLLRDLKRALEEDASTCVRGVTFSPVTGNRGTLEFFFHVRFGTNERIDLNSDILSSVQGALSLMAYRKDHHV